VDRFIALLVASACKNNVVTTFGKVLAHLVADARAASSDNDNFSSHIALQANYSESLTTVHNTHK